MTHLKPSFAAFVAIAAFLLAAPAAQAWYVDISITGAGRVYETTDANELDEHCPDSIEGFASPGNTPTGTLGASCRAGDASGDYGHGWVIRYVAEAAAGYRFAGWQSDGRTTPGPVLCDGSGGSSNYSGAACQFATFANLQTRARFVDDTNPAMLTLNGPNQAVNGATTFTFSATADPTVTGFECRVANVHDWVGCSSGRSENPASSGQYTFEVRAVDASNNKSPISTWNWTVDKIAPETSVTDGPTGTVKSTSASFEFSSNEQGAFQCSLDGAAFTSCSSPRAYSSLGQGQHTFDVRAVDAAGNQDATPVSRTWTVDTVAPDTSLGGGPGQGSSTTSTSATFDLTSEAGAQFRCQLDSAPPESSCTSPKTFSGLGLGQHTVKVWARDGVGNEDATPATRTWTVVATPDTAAPETSISSGPAQDSTTESTSATFEFGSSEAGSFECSLDGAAFSACSSPVTLTGLGVGAHAFSVRSRDGAGNVDASPATRAWTVRAASSPPGPGTDTSSGTPVTPPAPPVKPFDPRITSLFFYKGTKTRFTRLVVTDLPKGAKVNASCKGKGCAFKRKSIRTAGAKLNVLKKLKRVRLRSGAVLQLKITAPTGELKLATWKIRTGKAPAISYRCAPKGGKLARCD